MPARSRTNSIASATRALSGFGPSGEPRAYVRPYNRRLFIELCRATDAVVALLVFGIVFVVANGREVMGGLEQFLLIRLSIGNLLTLAAFVVVWQLLFAAFGLYDSAEPRRLRAEAPSVALACTLGSMTGLLPVAWSESGAFSASVVFIAWPLTIVATLGIRYLIRKFAERVQGSAVKRVVIVGSGPLAIRAFDALASDPEARHVVLGFVDTDLDDRFPVVRERLLGKLEDLEHILMHEVVDEVVVALPIKSHYADIQRVIEDCECAGVQSRYSAHVFPARLARPCLDPSDGQPAVAMKVVIDDYRLAIKRAIDIVAASLGLLALSPVLLAVAVAVKATSAGPVIFGQERYGWRKRRFRMYKFRTMVVNAEALQNTLESRNEAVGPVFKIRDDPRITPVGHFLRRTSLDELPQLWNVLRGDMSLVGPRPLPMRDVHRFEHASLMRRFSVLPGLTGLWQVSGRSNLTFDDWIQLDLRYIDSWSLRLDLTLLLRTIPVVVRGTGAT